MYNLLNFLFLALLLLFANNKYFIIVTLKKINSIRSIIIYFNLNHKQNIT